MGVCKEILLKAERTLRTLNLIPNALVFKSPACLETIKTHLGSWYLPWTHVPCFV